MTAWLSRLCRLGPVQEPAAEEHNSHDLPEISHSDRRAAERASVRLAKLTVQHARDMSRITRLLDSRFDALAKATRAGLETASLRLEAKASSLIAPLDDHKRSVTEINQQLTAIRDYAAHQQELLRRFQEGYDLKILQNLCQRLMHIVDQLDKAEHDNKASPDSANASASARDEILLALEAIGMEPYQPDIGTPYRGLEQEVEVLRITQIAPGAPYGPGTIAAIERRGLRYVSPDGAPKVIRPCLVVVAK